MVSLPIAGAIASPIAWRNAGVDEGAGGTALLNGSESDGTQLLGAGPATLTSGWSTLSATLTANAASAPGGGSTAATLRETVGGIVRHGIYHQPTITGGGTYTYSVYALSVTRRYLQILVATSGGTAATICAYFDLTGAAVTDSRIVRNSGTTTIGTPTIQAAVGGFYKCSIPGVLLNGTNTNPYFQIMCSDVATYGAPLEADSPGFVGNASNGLNIWRPKVA